MTFDDIAGLVLVLVLAAYLMWALLFPEQLP